MMLTLEQTTTNNTRFLSDTLKGLTATPKYMHSKYFYDEVGDRIFQQIMDMPEYYLTDAEMEIMKDQAHNLAVAIGGEGEAFDLIELGAGDATKSIHLLQALVDQGREFKYLPIDISQHVIEALHSTLPHKIPQLQFEGLNGDYFDMLRKAAENSDRKKVVLFMGANIGNMTVDEALDFCRNLKNHLSPNDMLVIGFDLKKNPQQILNAYNDNAGITRSFNLNLLKRINRELGGNFDLHAFDHYASYNPETGACKSYLISLKEQTVGLGNTTISFDENEYILMEISQKYAVTEIEELAVQSGFTPVTTLTDAQHYFIDAIWKYSN